LCQQLCSASPEAVRLTKGLIDKVAGADITCALIAETVEAIANVRTSESGQEGVQAFLNKRKPNWLTSS
jgi:methylglutaconyl-CoA hydratase